MREMQRFRITTLLWFICILVFIGALSLDVKPSIALAAEKDNCDKCGPTRLIGCRNGRCYYKCIRRCLGKDNKFYYEAVKFNFAGQRR